MCNVSCAGQAKCTVTAKSVLAKWRCARAMAEGTFCPKVTHVCPVPPPPRPALSLVHPLLRTHTHAPGRLHRPYNQRIISNATTTRPTCAANSLTSARERAGSGQTGQPQKRLLFQGMFTAPLAGGAGGRLQTIRVLPRNFSTPLYVFVFF